MWMIPIGFSMIEGIKSADAKAQADKYNAVVEAEAHDVAKFRADLNVQEVERQDRYQAGQTRAAYGASGVTMTGSPMDELAFQSINDKFKQGVARFNGLVNANADEASSQLDTFLAGETQQSGYIGAGGTLANGLIDRYYSPSSSPSSVPSDQLAGGPDPQGMDQAPDTGITDINGSGINIPGG